MQEVEESKCSNVTRVLRSTVVVALAFGTGCSATVRYGSDYVLTGGSVPRRDLEVLAVTLDTVLAENSEVPWCPVVLQYWVDPLNANFYARTGEEGAPQELLSSLRRRYPHALPTECSRSSVPLYLGPVRWSTGFRAAVAIGRPDGQLGNCTYRVSRDASSGWSAERAPCSRE